MNRTTAALAVSLLILGVAGTPVFADTKPVPPLLETHLVDSAKAIWHNAVADYVASHPAVFTGIISSADDGSVIITLPANSNNTATRSAVASAGRAQLASNTATSLTAAGTLRLSFKNVPDSKSTLTAAQDVITESIRAREPWALNIAQWGPDVTDGTLLVGVTNASVAAAAASSLTSRLGVKVKVEHDEFPGPTSTRTTDSSPFYGGDSIVSSTGNHCTSAFSVKKNGYFYELTAGHCGLGTWRVTAGASMGSVASQKYSSGGYDMEIINVAGAFPYVFIGTGTSTATRQISGTHNVTGGESQICMDGAATGLVCGNQVPIADTCITYGNGFSTCHLAKVVNSQFINIVQPGDSGGPAYFGTNPSYAAGVIVATSVAGQSSSQGYIQPIQYAVAQFGITVVT